MTDFAITIIAHADDWTGEEEFVLPPSVTNGIVEHLSFVGLTVDQIDVNFPDDGLVVYCFCGHEPSSHRWHNGQPEPWCFGCEDDSEHGVDPAHRYKEAS